MNKYMKFGQFKDSSLLKKLLIWFGFLAFGGILLMIIVSMLAMKGINMQQPTILRSILVYQDLFLFILPVILASLFWSEQPKQWLQLNTKTNPKILLGAILLMIVALPGSNLLAYLNQQITLPESLASVEQWMRMQEESAEQVLMLLLNDTRFGTFILNFIVIAVLAAIGEEFCFRGALQGLMKHTTTAIWITAFVFSTIHMQFYGFIPRLLLGALFGYALVWSNNLWLPITMHCTNNGMIAILYYIAQVKGLDTKKMDAFGTEDTLWVGILSLTLVIVGIYILRRSLTMSKASSRTSKGS